MTEGESREKEYIININPRILELLGPNLYTNIYYVLAELIANAYDAGAKNVYVIEKENEIIVEDDGSGMSYDKGDIEKYLDVAAETRTNPEESYVMGTDRKKMGRKGVGKLAALSVSERVKVMTIKQGEKSGFILSRYVGEDNKLEPLSESQIRFEKITGNGTSVVMTNPEYGLNKTAASIKKNLLKIFPLVNQDFRIHIKTNQSELTIEGFDKEMIQNLGALIMLGYDFHHLGRYFNSGIEDKGREKDLIFKEAPVYFPLTLKDRDGQAKNYELEIRGWIGALRITTGKKEDNNDFPDSFISIISNNKLGEYNIIPLVGKNQLPEVYLVGQLHVDLLEETELPDISLSNRQGYKTDDLRYQTVLKYVHDDLLPRAVELRLRYGGYKKDQEERNKVNAHKKDEESLIQKVEEYKKTASKNVIETIEGRTKNKIPEEVKTAIEEEINAVLPLLGIKKKTDSQKKRILISHTSVDKDLADIIHKMLSFNNVPDKDIIYTTSESEDCRVPNGMDIFQYLRDFFVDSISDRKMYVVYVTSRDMSKAWSAVSEVGAGWITESRHEIFNIHGFRPDRPLDTAPEWQTSRREGNNIVMNPVEFDKFVVKIIDICKNLGYTHRSKDDNLQELGKFVMVSH